MPTLPTSIRAALGLAATAVDEARKLPETLPQAVTTVPMIAMSRAMQASLRMQQHIATLAARGDEVLTHLHRTSAEAPPWATFDDELAAPTADEATPKAAFDTIDYEHTGFSEGDDGPARWDAVGVCDEPLHGLHDSPDLGTPDTDPALLHRAVGLMARTLDAWLEGYPGVMTGNVSGVLFAKLSESRTR